MKRMFLVLMTALLLCLLPLFALGEPVILKNGQYGSIYSATNLSDGCALLCTNTFIREDGSEIPRTMAQGLLYKLGAGGEVVWTYRASSDVYETSIFCDAVELSDGSVAASLHQYGGGYDAQGNGMDRYLIVHLTADGRLIGEYPVNQNDLTYRLGDGFVLMEYEKESMMTYTAVSPLGETLWRRHYPKNLLMGRSATASSGDGGCVTPGAAGVTKLDKKGEIVWQLDVNKDSGEGQERSIHIVRRDTDGSFIGVGGDATHTGSYDDSTYELTQALGLIVRIGADGEALWMKNFALDERFSRAYEDLLLTEQGILVLGTMRSDTQATFTLLDPNGELIKSWKGEKRDDVLRTGQLLMLGGEIWTAHTVEVEDYNHLELERVVIPQ